jgi:ribosomal protein S9
MRLSAIVNPLLADQGAPMDVIPRMKKQIERLKKLRDDSQQKARDLQQPAAALAEAAQSLHVAVSRHGGGQARQAKATAQGAAGAILTLI